MNPLWNRFRTRTFLSMLAFLLPVFFLWSPTTAEASHFRGGTLSYVVTSGRSVKVTIDAYIRINSSGGNGTLYWGDGKSSGFSGGSNRSQYLRRSTVTHTYSRDNLYTAYWGSCCWISGVSNRSSSWRHEIKIRIRSGHKGGPQFNSPAFFTSCSNAPFIANMNGADPDRGTITYKAVGFPSGMTLNTSTGEVKWSSPKAGYHGFTVIGTSSKSSATIYREVLLEIKGTCNNKPPTISLSPSTATVKGGTKVCTKVSASDPDRNRLTYVVSPSKPGATAPPSNQASPHSWTWCWTPTKADEGTRHDILFTVVDNGRPNLNAQVRFLITVSSGVPPNITVSPTGTTKTVNEGSSTTFYVTASDPDGNGIASFTVSGVPSFCTASKSGTKYTVTCKPGYTHGTKDYPLTFSATDRDGKPKTTTLKVTVRVNNVNRAPTITGPASSYTIKENQNLKFTATIKDADGNLHGSYFSCSKPSGASCTLSGSGGSTRYYNFSWTPNYSQSGTHKVTISARDTSGATVSKTITITVTNVNRAPTITGISSSYSGKENARLTFSGTISDPDGNLSTTTFSCSKPSGSSCTLGGSGTSSRSVSFSWTPTYSQSGTHYVTISMKDTNGVLASKRVTLSISNVNRAPTWSGSTSYSGSEGSRLTFTMTATDPDGNSITPTYGSLPSGAKVTLGGSGSKRTYFFDWTPGFSQAGTYTVTFYAKDSLGAQSSRSVTIKIGNKNRAPTISNPGTRSCSEGKSCSFSVTGSDPDGNSLTNWRYSGLPSGSRISGTGNTKTFSWTPSYSQAGSYKVTFTVNDTGSPSLSTSRTVTINVANVNRAPTWSGATSYSVKEGSRLTFTLTATDPDGNSITPSNGPVPSGASKVAYGGTGSKRTYTFNWTPSYSQSGTYRVVFYAKDSLGLQSSRTVTITVTQVNRNPVLSNPGNKSVSEGQAFSFTITASDPDGDAIAWQTTTGVPSGARVSGTGNSRTFSWTPSYTQAGTYYVTFNIADSNGGRASRRITITVVNKNRAPVFANPGNKSVREGSLLSFSMTASDPDGNALRWSSAGVPSGASFSGSGGKATFSWRPTFSQAGTYKVTFTVTDNGSPNLATSQTITISVGNSNRAPSFPHPGNKTVAENSTLTFGMTATDPDGNALTWTIASKPSGASFSGSGGKATFSWRPTYTQAGSYTITVTVTDNGSPSLSTSQRITITVTNTNRAPILVHPGNKSGSEGKLLSFSISASDPDGNSLTWSATGVPSGAKITGTGNSRTFSWTPGYTQAGTYRVTFKVTDNGSPALSASQIVTITIGNINRAPSLTNPGNKTVAENSTLTFSITGSDPDGNSLTWKYAGVPTGASISTSGNTKTFSWRPSYSQAGRYTVTFTVTDNGSPALSASRSVVITVGNTNRAPTLSSPGNKSVTENQLLTFSITGADADGNALTWKYSGIPTGASISGTGNTKTFSWRPSFSQAGRYTVTFTVTDNGSPALSASRSVSITVGNTNRAPVLTNPGSKTVAENSTLTFTITGSDPDGDIIAWNYASVPRGSSITRTGNTVTFTWKPAFSQAGKYTVTFNVIDDGSPRLSASRSVSITVGNTNRAPTLSNPGSKTVAENNTLTFTISGSDPDGNKITWSYASVPRGASITGTGNTKTFTWKPDFTQTGKYTVVFTVTDDGSPQLKGSRSVVITVTNTNRAPQLTDPGSQTVGENKLLTFTITGSDPDGNNLAWKYSGIPSGGKVSGTGNTKTFTWTPGFNAAGSYTVTFVVTDDSSPALSATRKVVITVANTNRAPMIVAVKPLTVNENQLLTFKVSASDPDGNKLTWSTKNVPVGATFNGVGTSGSFSWKPSYAQAGKYTLTLTVTDDGSPKLSHSINVSITVNNVNRAPIFKAPTTQGVNENSKLVFTVSASDPDGNKLTWSSAGIPSGATFSTSGDTRTFTWTPSFSQSGKYTVTFTVVDDGSPRLSAKHSVVITVSNKNRGPSLTDPGAQKVNEGQKLTFTISGTDPDGNALNWKYDNVPRGAQITGAGDTKTFSWTPSYTQAGSYKVRFTVLDNGTPQLGAAREVTITVANINRRPSITDPGSKSVAENKLLTFSVTGSDPDGNNLTWSITGTPSGARVSGTGNTKTFSWTPSFTQSGSYTVTFKVTDDGKPNLSFTRTVKISVNNINRAPSLTDPGAQKVDENKLLTFRIKGSDPDGNSLTWKITGTPSGAKISTGSTNERVFEWKPSFSQAGSYTVTFTVTDSGTPALSATRTVSITVSNVNRNPVLTNPGAQSVAEGKLLTFTISGSDPDGNKITWSYASVPTGAKITGTGNTKTFTWTPSFSQSGKFDVTFTVVDDGSPKLSARRVVTIQVANINLAPKLTNPGAQKVAENSRLTFTVNGSDPDNNALTWKVTGTPKGASVAATSNSRTFTWTPTFEQAGSYTVTFEVVDSGTPSLSARVSVTITVTNVNRAPKITSLPAKVATEDKQYTYNASAKDPDAGAVLTWTLVKGAPRSTIDKNSGAVNWKPITSEAEKTFAFEIKVCDKLGLCDTQSWSVKVTNVNDPPVITSKPPQPATEDKRYTYSPKFVDPDPGDAHVWKFLQGPKEMNMDPKTGFLFWTPSDRDAGKTVVVEIQVCDKAGVCANQKWNLQVGTVNDPPKITSIPPTVALESKTYTYAAKVTDPDTGDTHTWKLLKGAPGSKISSTGVVTWPTNSSNANKTYDFEIQVCDKAGACDKQAWKVTVRNTNNAPKITSTPPITGTENVMYTYRGTATDADANDPTVWTISVGPKSAKMDPKTGVLTWTPGDDDAGNAVAFEIKACDQAGVCDTQKWTVRVKNVNDAPKITSTPATSTREKKGYTYRAEAKDADQGDILTWKLVAGPKGAAIDSNNGVLRWQPGQKDAGKAISFTIEVCDIAKACDKQSWSVQVINDNDSPVITSTPVKTATEDQNYIYGAQATDPDPNDVLRWNLLKGPNGASMDAKTGRLTWKPADKDAGKDIDFEIEVCDNGNNCDTQSWTVKVSNVNDAPKITSTPNTDAVEDRLYSYSPTFEDSDANDTHTWRLLKGPKGATVNSKTGELEWTPTNGDAGKSFDFEIEVCDQDRDCDTQKWTVKVKDVNDGPSITSKPPTKAEENKTYTYAPTAIDPDPNDTLTWTGKELPTGAKIDSKTGKVTWTPGTKEAGKTYDFEIEVCDKAGQCKSQRWQVTVDNKNDPPKITGNPEEFAYVGQKWSYEPIVDDNDPSDTHTWGFKKAPAGALIDRQTGKITWTPVNGDANKTYDFEIEVCDDGKPIICARQTFKVKVIKTCLTDSNCPDDRICQDRKCVDVECSTKKPCKSGEFCISGKCKQDPCKTIQCAKDEICRPTDGKCIYPCAGVLCSKGQVCKDGKCTEDPCAATPCQKGEICDNRTDPANPTCIKNPCDTVTCKNGRVCDQDGQCVDDPCQRMTCPGKGQRCVAGQCVDRLPCKVDSDCPSDDVCLEGRCSLPGCYKGTTCAKDEFCVQSSCVKDPCLDENGRSKCGAGEFCRRLDGKCAKSCSKAVCTKGEVCVDGSCVANPCDAVTCAAGKICVSGKCEDDKCNASNVCKHKRVCNPKANRCSDDPCAGVKCPGDKEVCNNGQCVPPPACTVDKDCPADRLCKDGKCSEPNCLEDGDCQANEACVGGECKADLCKSKTCGKGQFCRAGQCFNSCSGVYCKDGEQCVNGRCVTDPCANAQCNVGEKCINGQCRKEKCGGNDCKNGRVCQVDRCVQDPCESVVCPDGEACGNGQCGGSRACKFDRDCPGSAICVNKLCKASACNAAGCKGNELCYDGRCTANQCVNRNCAEDEFCNPKSGKCEKTCPTCPSGEYCKEGACVASQCPKDGCAEGERCIKGECVKDECVGAGANTCKFQRQCFDNKCVDDPCDGVKCADGQTCRNGVCYGKPKPTETPKEAVVSEPSDENTGDGGADSTDGGSADKKSGGKGGDGDGVDIPNPTPGCDCSATQVPSGLPLVLLFLFGLFTIRRRRR